MTQLTHFGFTGTRHGATEAQLRRLSKVLHVWSGYRGNQTFVAHHGDCVGADEQVHHMIKSLGWLSYAHPMDPPDHRAYVNANFRYPPKPPLARNRDIVMVAFQMYALPFEMTEQLRSGTWATIRYTIEAGKPLTVILPNGDAVTHKGRYVPPSQQGTLNL
jgi:hypothetical protein